MSQKNPSKFNRIFDPEFLGARKDITPIELACAKGDIDAVVNALQRQDHEELLCRQNRDGNTLLLLAVANGHCDLSQLLLDAKSDLHLQNGHRLDAVDYGLMDSVISPLARVILSGCDFVVPEVIEGPFEKSSRQLLGNLVSKGMVLCRTSVIGKTPDFRDIFARETEYRRDWLKKLFFMTRTVKRGLLLLDDDIAYMESDALITGSLEVPVANRYMYVSKDSKIVNFSDALKGDFQERLDVQLCRLAYAGNSMSVQGLLKAKAGANIEDKRGEFVLSRACHNGDAQTIKCLLIQKASVNNANKDGFTALHLACTRGNIEAVRVLLRAKADLFAKTHKGHNVLEMVKHEGQQEVLGILQDERAARKMEKVQQRLIASSD